MKRVPSLDGLRAISIVLVLLSHLFLHTHPTNQLQSAFLAIIGDGETGVSIFFVISGFLITFLLMKEKQADGQISLSGFYIRRIFRILPAFLLYVAVVALLAKAGIISVPAWQFARALTFTMDYVAQKNWYLGHMWSLSVEEQFYIIWPVLAVFCSRKALVLTAMAVIILEPFIRLADRILLPSTRYQIIYMGHTRIDMLMFGCLLALLYKNDRFFELMQSVFRKNGPAVAAIFLFVLSPLLEWKIRGLYLLTVGYTLQGTSIVVIMLYVIQNPTNRLGRILNSQNVVRIGVLSYSLYLWQQLFIGYDTFTTRQSLIGMLFVLPAATLSYYFVEKPMLRVKTAISGPSHPVTDMLPEK